MTISNLKFYGGSREKVCRLGLAHIFLELQELLMSIEVKILEKKQANGAGRVRELIDQRFIAASDWVQSRSADIDWVKRLRYNETIVSRMGVEIQVSGRSDLLAGDIVRIRNILQDSRIDVGVIVVPSDRFEYYLTGRVANYTFAVRYVEQELREAQAYPIVLMSIEHDGFSSEALARMTTNRGGPMPIPRSPADLEGDLA
jgi:hypothetical protein